MSCLKAVSVYFFNVTSEVSSEGTVRRFLCSAGTELLLLELLLRVVVPLEREAGCWRVSLLLELLLVEAGIWDENLGVHVAVAVCSRRQSSAH